MRHRDWRGCKGSHALRIGWERWACFETWSIPLALGHVLPFSASSLWRVYQSSVRTVEPEVFLLSPKKTHNGQIGVLYIKCHEKVH